MIQVAKLNEADLQEDRHDGRRIRWVYRLKHNETNEYIEACSLHHIIVLDIF
jgi:hypothetical protein